MLLEIKKCQVDSYHAQVDVLPWLKIASIIIRL
jgi:hypothetical protein